MNLQNKIARLAEFHDRQATECLEEYEASYPRQDHLVDLLVLHREVAHDLRQMIIGEPIAEEIECKCGLRMPLSRDYCDCGRYLEPF